MLAIVCPGQGSQTPGFLAPWLELDGIRHQVESLGAAAGLDLLAHGTVSDAETIKDTAIAQPLIVAAGLVSLRALFDALSRDAGAAQDGAAPASTDRTAVGAWAGHSVGELTAAAAAGVLTAEQAMIFVRERGRAMAAASAVTPTGMSAVLGGVADDVLEAIERHGLTPANNNGGGQIVAAGTLEQLAAFAADPPARTRIRPLEVAGAFHTTHMSPAVEVLTELAATLSPQDPTAPLLSNADGQLVADGTDTLRRLVGQVSNPVRWDLCMHTLLELGVTGIIELAPAGTLVGLAKRAMKGVPAVALKAPEDLEAACSLVREHGSREGSTHDDGGATRRPDQTDTGVPATNPSSEEAQP
ncbi:MAG: ACP S-malonyltransferase [Micrococcales bacterium]|nr:ACP S-malonyltransferase [Micrococcales bacterium]